MMMYEDVVGGTFETVRKPLHFTNRLSTNNDLFHHLDESTINFDDEFPDGVPNDNVVEKDDMTSLSTISDIAQNIIDDQNTTNLKILLGAAWIDSKGWKLFQRFPEVLFLDTTFKTITNQDCYY